MEKLYKKMIDEAMGAQRADVNILKAKRGGPFKVADGQGYVDAVNKMKAEGDQSKAVIDLHVQSVNAHFDTLKGLTDFVKPEDDPFVEHYQTPVVLEILCD